MKRKTTVVLEIIIVLCAAICGIWLSGRRNGANTQEELHVPIAGDSISEGQRPVIRLSSGISIWFHM